MAKVYGRRGLHQKEEVYFKKVLGTHLATGRIIAMRLVNPTSGPVRSRVEIDFAGIGTNEYEITLVGGRSGFLSTSYLNESPTWLANEINIFFKAVTF